MNDWHLARGYRYAGVVGGLRSEPNRRDVAVIVSDAGRSRCARICQLCA